MLQCVAVCCSMLQCVAVHCSVSFGVDYCRVLQRAAMCRTVLQRVYWRVLQCVAVCCSVLQCVALCRSVLQCAELYCSVSIGVDDILTSIPIAAVCCSVLQCVAVCYYVITLQCVAVYCKVSFVPLTYSPSFVTIPMNDRFAFMHMLTNEGLKHVILLRMMDTLQGGEDS